MVKGLFLFFALTATLAFASDGTQSVLKTDTTAVATPSSCSNGTCSTCVKYHNKEKIAPCATQKVACLSYCEKSVDACCNQTAQQVVVEVPVCAPPCPSKESISRSRNGKRAVYDYGRYEIVLKANEDGDVNVRYRKRILDR